jgi:glycine betaine/proline transport system permease protein
MFWDRIVGWININLYFITKAVKTWSFIYVLRPLKSFLLYVPWLGVVAIVAAAGFRLGGLRLAITVGSILTFIAIVGLWDRAMISIYLTTVSLFLATLIGTPLGIYAAWNDRANNVLQVIIDAVQTIPTFVYLIPIVMLFSIGDFAGLIAITVYSLAPVIRYTNLGIRLVPPALIEAARAAGCTNLQILMKVQLRLALPEIMLGLNQTLMMALSMLVISALVGTRGLELETLEALSYFYTGKGLIAGLAIAGIAIVVDRLVNAWSNNRKVALGLAV